MDEENTGHGSTLASVYTSRGVGSIFALSRPNPALVAAVAAAEAPSRYELERATAARVREAAIPLLHEIGMAEATAPKVGMAAISPPPPAVQPRPASPPPPAARAYSPPPAPDPVAALDREARQMATRMGISLHLALCIVRDRHAMSAPVRIDAAAIFDRFNGHAGHDLGVGARVVNFNGVAALDLGIENGCDAAEVLGKRNALMTRAPLPPNTFRVGAAGLDTAAILEHFNASHRPRAP